MGFLSKIIKKDEERRRRKELEYRIDLLDNKIKRFKTVKERLFEYYEKLKNKDEKTVVYLHTDQDV